MTAEWLINDCLITVEWLPNDYYLTAKWLIYLLKHQDSWHSSVFWCSRLCIHNYQNHSKQVPVPLGNKRKRTAFTTEVPVCIKFSTVLGASFGKSSKVISPFVVFRVWSNTSYQKKNQDSSHSIHAKISILAVFDHEKTQLSKWSLWLHKIYH